MASVVGDGLDTLPHLPGVVALEMILHRAFVVRFCLSHAPLQVGASSAVEGSVARPEGCITSPEKHADVDRHSGFLVGIYKDGFIHSDVPNTVLDVVQYSLCEHSEVFMMEGIPLGDLKAVLELRPGGDGPPDGS